LAQIEAAETALPITELVERAAADAVVEDYEFPVIGCEGPPKGGHYVRQA
jgi:hypothetical protein